MISFERVFREKRSLMLPLVIALAVNVALLVLAVLPLTRSVAAEEARAVETAQARLEAQRTFARADAIVKGKARADRELARFYGEVLPPNQSGAVRISYANLQQLARNAGLRVDRQVNSQRDPETGGGLTTYRVELTLSGPYRGIRQFIHAIETQPSFLVIESLELASAAGQNEPLQVTVNLATYYRVTDGN
jgi:hypothetical protein